MANRPPHATKHCRHYSYVRAVDGGPRCSQGIDLSAPGAAMQCMPPGAQEGKTFEPCAWREEFTEPERAAWEGFRNDRAARMIAIMPLIPGSSRDRKNKPFWGKTGRFDCPACGDGTVRWVRARTNGHLAAACSTPDCFEVIE